MTKSLRLNAILAADLPTPPTGRGATNGVILTALRDAGRPLAPLEILTRTGVDYQALRQQLVRLTRRGDIERLGRGWYMAHPLDQKMSQ